MMAQQRSHVLLISYTQELKDGKPLYVSSNCLPLKVSKFEPAGHSFHSAALRLSGYCEEDSDKDDDKSVSNDKETFTPSFESYSGKSKKKSGGDGKQQQDHYALLGLAHLRYLATEEQIRKSYRDVALKYHPDKQAALLLLEKTEASKQAKKDEIENHFKAIQEAYELLIDPQKRRMYDSTDEFDDEIPTDCAPQDFFKVFGPAFMRNSRWSVNQPAPSLGDDNSSFEEVEKFYNFWYSYKSWREFPHEDEFDLEQAESRDHKRWMERQNAKLSEKARKEEYTRVRSLVDNAYKRDPRIAKRKEFEKAEKKRKKESKFLAKKLEEEEAARVAEEERLKKEEEDKKAAEAAVQQKKAKEKEKKLVRKERTRLRSLASEVASGSAFDISGDDVETLCMSLDMERLKNLCNKLEGKAKEEQVKLLKDSLSGKVSEENGPTPAPNPTPKPTGAVKSNGNVASSSVLEKKEKEKEKPWVKEEIDLLRKGIQKFPKGTSRRWEVISEYIGTGRSVEEILKATKTVLLQKPDSSKAFDSFLEKRKPAVSISSPLSTRDEVPAVNGPVNGPESVPVPEPVADATSSTTTSTDSPNVSSSTDIPSASSDPDVWSSVQERALLQALKTFPKETAQRWERVAAAVPGKTVNNCKKKLASLKETFRSKKTTA
ncbi:hypothetical protein SOVF_141200 [Spinacia oleracea]|uniref:J domain-containing protein n=1 Tax=Spinacia oleracea TaxID=3562 RepID=A0A9R0K3H3_SPIOL|nr:uncharacterized protein LOC110795697 [Spinacia oleracea]KNA10779.1 hypothetical protein SOVF_141200 [Spinacia oleracea]